MPAKTKRSSVDKTESPVYKRIGDNFYAGALAEKKAGRWNSSGVLLIHAAIAYADAVSIKYSGVKSKGDDHQDVVRLLENIIPPNDDRKNALNQLERLIAHKTAVSYSGQQYDAKDIDKLSKHLERFKNWVDKQLED